MALSKHMQLMEGEFDKLSPEEQEFVMEIKGNFHYRNGHTYPDGSMGSIDISPKQLNNALAYVLNKFKGV